MSTEEDMSSSNSSAGEESGDSELSNGSELSNDSIYKYGGMRNFVQSYGLKMYNDDDVEEAKAMATEMRRQDDQETELGGADLESEPANQSSTN